ncbi:MAG: low molecular weight phosphotyrosine protein phosphatase [Paludibacteraceae bacterium]|nr:low molecular weight phosphotyrosine protein phosphatase [Paludibacteraceae bacterium]
MIKIVFVCHGNICRSPMAEFVMRSLANEAGRGGEFEIASAAVSREETGNDIYPPAKRKLTEKGIPFTRRSASQITLADYQYYDYVVCMDRSNLRYLERIIGDDTCHKVSLLMEWTGVLRDVADPWYTGDFEIAYQDILNGCKAMLEQI